jgi:ribosomal protein L16/L10AE
MKLGIISLGTKIKQKNKICVFPEKIFCQNKKSHRNPSGKFFFFFLKKKKPKFVFFPEKIFCQNKQSHRNPSGK